MGKPKNYISETAAAETLRRLFADDSEVDQLSLEEVYNIAGRADLPESTNRNWLNNKMTQLKYHNLIKAVHTFDKTNRRHKVTGIQLTMAGKKALGRVDGGVNGTETDDTGDDISSGSRVSLSDVAKAVEEFQQSNPNFEVIFDVKFKGVNQPK